MCVCIATIQKMFWGCEDREQIRRAPPQACWRLCEKLCGRLCERLSEELFECISLYMYFDISLYLCIYMLMFWWCSGYVWMLFKCCLYDASTDDFSKQERTILEHKSSPPCVKNQWLSNALFRIEIASEQVQSIRLVRLHMGYEIYILGCNDIFHKFK